MPKTAVQTALAPAAIGPYSQAVKVGPFVFTSGQIGLDPATGEMVRGGIEPEAERVLDNLGEVLAAAGARWTDVVKTTIFLCNLGDFQTVNAIYARRFPDVAPARATVEVSKLPRGALVEIDAIAYVETSP